MNQEQSKHLLIVEFRTDELRASYAGLTIEEHVLNDTWIIHVVNQNLKDDNGKSVDEKIINVMGTYDRKSVEVLVEHLKDSSGENAFLVE